ncbi:alpha-D-ribose 1-methylphosphonate 5-triphosphate synthase subunit PhnG [Amycolatopsis bartoniae]|uniref:hypothetical protein n=1 Tax=Amycolatopsis bartoniae TaxID=941986 RepID=UPI0017B89441|nr:hypothetical protein [Amycolatopsis bartoniae]MBB2934141.1 alpha-D-ribose 1-methylphosphonate 5-triphosphate synthase subunit PhnG [Amycolatopsis bartoniae]
MDATLVLKRSRGQADGVLHVTGRDVEEAEYAMSFDATCGAWAKLDGPAGDYQLHDTRALIARFVRDHPGSRPTAIADALQLKPNRAPDLLAHGQGQPAARRAERRLLPARRQ